MWTVLPLLLPSPCLQDQVDPYVGLANHQRETVVTRVVEAVTPSVVSIETETTIQRGSWPFASPQVGRGGGTGVVLTEDGYVITNYHVVRGANRIQVSFADDPDPYAAEILSFKEEADLALLLIRQKKSPNDQGDRRGTKLPGGKLAPQEQATGRRRFQAIRMGRSFDLMAGETVIAIGNPHGQTHTVSTGIVSGLHRNVQVPAPHNLRFEGLIQTDASINLGNSGGPLLNVRGELIGINTVMNSSAENMGFAIPVDQVRAVLKDELYPNASSACWLGLEVSEQDPLLISKVWEDSPAALAGVCKGDRLKAVDGHALSTHADWILTEPQIVPGSLVRLDLAQGEKTRSASLRAWDKTDGILFQRMGATFETFRAHRQDMAVVTRVASSGPAAEIGLEKGDLLPVVKIGRLRGRSFYVRGKVDLAHLVERFQAGAVFHLNVYRDLNQDGTYNSDEALEGDLQIR